MNEVLKGKINARINEDELLRELLFEKHIPLSGSIEILLGYYLDGKMKMEEARELMGLVSRETVERIAELVLSGRRSEYAEAKIWFDDHGFCDDFIQTPNDIEGMIREIHMWVENRLVSLKQVDVDLGLGKSMIPEFVAFSKDYYFLDVGQKLNIKTPLSESREKEKAKISVMVAGYRIFCQWGEGYVKAMMDLKKKRGFEPECHIMTFLSMVEAKISLQTIIDLYMTIDDLMVPHGDISYKDVFGNSADMIIGYWIRRIREDSKTDDRYGYSRYRNGYGYRTWHVSYRIFLYCVGSSKAAARYALEVMDWGDETAWFNLMNAFDTIWEKAEAAINQIFEWLYDVKPKTRVVSACNIIDILINSPGHYDLDAIVLSFNHFPKKELLAALHEGGVGGALRKIYNNSLGGQLSDAILHIGKQLAELNKESARTIVANMSRIISRCGNKEEMRVFLCENLYKLTRDQFDFMCQLAENGADAVTVEVFRHVAILADKKCLNRIVKGIEKVDKVYWPEVLRLEATVCSVINDKFTINELMYLLEKKVPDTVISAAEAYYFLYSWRKDKRAYFANGREIFFDWLASYQREEQLFRRLVGLGANDPYLFYLGKMGDFVSDEFIKYWAENKYKKTPATYLMLEIGTSLPIPYYPRSEECDLFMRLIAEREQDVGLVYKAYKAGLDLEDMLKMALRGELTEKRISELLM